jgi:hypothetical protein
MRPNGLAGWYGSRYKTMEELSFPELPGWSFSAQEVSANVFRVIGRDLQGRSVESEGLDLDLLLEECRIAAKRLTERNLPPASP